MSREIGTPGAGHQPPAPGPSSSGQGPLTSGNEETISEHYRVVCAICDEVLNEDAVAINCGHMFHRLWLRKWFSKQRTCSCCRVPVDEDTLLKLHPTTSTDDDFKKLKVANRTLRDALQASQDAVQIKEAEIESLSLSKDREIALLKAENARMKTEHAAQVKQIETMKKNLQRIRKELRKEVKQRLGVNDDTSNKIQIDGPENPDSDDDIVEIS